MFQRLILATLLTFPILGHSQTFESSPQQTALLELYSSEGCSSCPPADRWVASLKNHKGLWTNFVPLNFHVDYWNYLGWVDPFSNKRFAQRQRRYASEWKSSRVYTPGFVLNGKEWRARNVENLKGQKVGVLKAEKIKDDLYKVTFSPQKKHQNLKINIALLGNGLSTNVKYGENSGKTLNHEFVVLGLKSSPLSKKGKIYEGTVQVPSNKSTKAKNFSVAFWVNAPGSQKPLQAVGGPLQ